MEAVVSAITHRASVTKNTFINFNRLDSSQLHSSLLAITSISCHNMILRVLHTPSSRAWGCVCLWGRVSGRARVKSTQIRRIPLALSASRMDKTVSFHVWEVGEETGRVGESKERGGGEGKQGRGKVRHRQSRCNFFFSPCPFWKKPQSNKRQGGEGGKHSTFDYNRVAFPPRRRSPWIPHYAFLYGLMWS